MNKRYSFVNNWLIDIPSGTILHLTTGEHKRLGEYQLKLLDVLAREAGRLITKDELTSLVWEGRIIGNNSLPNAIHALRVALEDDGKQQKIIKTIPKKGYLLEPEYCHYVEKEEEDNGEFGSENSFESLIDKAFYGDGSLSECLMEGGKQCPPSELIDHEIALLPTSTAVHVLQQRIIFFLLLLLTALCSIAIMFWLVKHHREDPLIVKEIQDNVYSNIRLYAIDYKDNPSWGKSYVYNRLKDTFYTLNEQLKMEKITMDIYFMSEGQTLNATFKLSNDCDQKTLVMTIYHWRIVQSLLSNLIKNETGRKINELSTCETKE
ncbi:hypothetical protein Z042_08640 [Chania multitudinisentens RB-25]|uniref:OmpR/PhoB-type domain-containing protein n=1 Tax=Chania multitudinisentens RB-25 TaxID=1441930 RepID=W0L7F8_9GAMM|nr:transcriptional regulator [Chania multitudinisentens]AHG19681.1 hypothetical protein Z042_08640 [Chania multitudinisentens RB-25]